MDSERLVTVRTFYCMVEANLARSVLEGFEISCWIPDEEMHYARAGSTILLGWIRLQVSSRDAERAAELLASSPVAAPPEATEPVETGRSGSAVVRPTYRRWARRGDPGD